MNGGRMSKRRDKRPTSHEVTAPPEFRPSSYFVRFVPIPGKPGSLRSVPARRQDCKHCGEELRPAEFAGVRYRDCPNACMDTFDEARAEHYACKDPDPPASYDVQGRL